ncbi:hypothetical protein F53441_8987 [Fusarium austroafricanum]|uniref:Nephrocystin 3-like N-terminal domain-containing protein n=1 Tax=Fusarium austroafricanum TaxID=2364996 RepID=A0A8H4KDD3_9HYPO|nr:hypothetical protein F53441_8987 [Fusarium austroafricanum]
MSFASSSGQFNAYQPFGAAAGSASSQKSTQPFSSTVDFSDPSYDMPYFSNIEAPVSNTQPSHISAAPKQSAAGTPRGFIPKQISSSEKTKSFDKMRTSSFPKGALLGQPSQPLDTKVDYTEFLKSLEFPSIADYRIDPKSLDNDLNQWLVRDQLFVRWRSSTGLLWLRGTAGSGKTTLMKQALDTCMKEPKSIHLTYSFSPSGSELPRTRFGLFRSLLHQLIPQSPEAFKDIKARFDKIQSSLPPKQQVAWNTQEIFDDLIKILPKVLKSHSITIYVDGINYSEGETATKLVQGFSKLIEKCQAPAKDPTLAENTLKIIFSSTVCPAKDPFPKSYIQVDEKNGPSLRRFLEGHLSNIDFNTQQLVLSKSGTSFISARLITNHLKFFGPAQSSLIQQPSPTPAPTNLLLETYFQDMLYQGGNGLLSLLKWCCLSSRPLTLPELRVALAIDITEAGSIRDLSQAESFSRYGTDESLQSWIKTTSLSLLETVNVSGQRVVKTIHDSVSSFFISKGLNLLSQGSHGPDASITPLQQAHYSIATSLLRYITLLSKEPQWESMTRTQPTLQLFGYSGANWSHHISAAGLGKTEASKIIKLLGLSSDQTLKVLVKLGQGSPTLGDLHGTHWAHLFAIYGHAYLLSVAVKKSGNGVLDVQDLQKRTPLHLAALYGHSTVSKQLLKSGAKTSARTTNGNTALHFAALQGHQSIMKYLVERDPSLVSAMDNQSQTPLFSAVFRGGSSAIKFLFDSRADIRALDTYNNSILHHAVTTDKSSILKLFIDRGADLNWQNGQGRTPLHVAIVGGHASAVKSLLESRSRTDISDNAGRRALHEAVASGNKSLTQLLLKYTVDVDARDNEGQAPLEYAVQSSHKSLVKLLLEVKANVNGMDRYGFKMIMVAVRASDEKLTRILLEGNPDLDQLSHERHTVAFYAVFKGRDVSFLTEEEQSIASLLFRRYQKGYPVWNAEWKQCHQEFMAKHGKKKDTASKPKTKLKSKVKNTPLPSSTESSKSQKPRKPSKSPSNTVAKPPSADPNTRAIGSQGPQESSKLITQPEVIAKPQKQSQVQGQAPIAGVTFSPFAPNSSVPKASSGVQQSQTTAPKTTPPTSIQQEMQRVHPVSSFAAYQPSHISGGNGSSASPNKEQPSKPPQAPQSGSTPSTKTSMVQRSSWDIYSSLSSGPPPPTQTAQAQKPCVPYPGTSQTPPGGSSTSTRPFQPFQSFQPVQIQKGASSTAPMTSNQFEKRYSPPNSWGQPNSAGSGSPAGQPGTPQTYQSFDGSSQKPNSPPYQSQIPYQKPSDQTSAAKPGMPQGVARKPVGGQAATPPPMAQKPAQQSPFLPWQ